MSTQNLPQRPDMTSTPKPVTEYIHHLETALEKSQHEAKRYKLLGRAVAVYTGHTYFHGQSDEDCASDSEALASFFWENDLS